MENIQSLLPDSFHLSIHDYVNQLHSFLTQWKQLFQYNEQQDHVILFFTNHHFTQRLPHEWQLLASQMTIQDLIQMVKYGTTIHSSLQSFVQKAKSFYLKSKSIVSHEMEQQELHGEILRGMNQKKQYEVELLAKIIAKYAKNYNCDSVLDIGSGKGYLSHVLAYEYELSVLAIDNNEMVVHKSNVRSDQLSSKNKQQQQQKKTYKAISAHVTTDQVQFERLISESSSLSSQFKNMCLIGLHTCGDLAPTTIQMFLAHERAKSMVNVGCCYHKLTTDGYPMSNYLKCKLGGLDLTNGGQVLACSAIEKWDTIQDAISHFKRNAHRCALESYLYQYHDDNNNNNSSTSKIIHSIGSVPNQYSNTFVTYAIYALSQMKNKGQITSPQLLQLMNEPDTLKESLDTYYTSLGPEPDGTIRTLSLFWSLRALLGPVIESLIMMDRYLYLMEQPAVAHADILRVFDEDVSPRNMILVASKSNMV
jgi:hypothetical protein